MSKSNVILTGFMGTGKTALGQPLARALHYEFIDTDHFIEERTGQTVSEIFAREGEAAFRQIEADLVQELAARQGAVIATGGGLMLNAANAAALKRTGLVFCLVASVEEIFERISRQPGSRPLLKDPNPRLKITELLEERAAIYAQFPQISTSGKSRHQLVDELLQQITARG